MLHETHVPLLSVPFPFHTCYASQMQDQRETEADLIFDVRMALHNAPLRNSADKEWLAKKIVAHLKMCGWMWRRKGPEKPHGNFMKSGD